MVRGLIGKKIEMTQVFDEHGRVIPVTKIKIEPNFVAQVKTTEKDGYKVAQIGAQVEKKPKKPTGGHAKRAGLKFVPKHLREVPFEGEISSGQEVRVEEVFRKGGLVDITGHSKGKGFAGVVKRWGFAGGPRTHGQSDRERAPGSIGATTTPGRVFKGLKMAGHMGFETFTIKGLEIIEVKKDENELWVKGSVPGSRSSLLLTQKSLKKKKAYHEPEIPTAPIVADSREEAKEGEEEKQATEGPPREASESHAEERKEKRLKTKDESQENS